MPGRQPKPRDIRVITCRLMGKGANVSVRRVDRQKGTAVTLGMGIIKPGRLVDGTLDPPPSIRSAGHFISESGSRSDWSVGPRHCPDRSGTPPEPSGLPSPATVSGEALPIWDSGSARADALLVTRPEPQGESVVCTCAALPAPTPLIEGHGVEAYFAEAQARALCHQGCRVKRQLRPSAGILTARRDAHSRFRRVLLVPFGRGRIRASLKPT